MLSIWKFPVEPGDDIKVEMPKGAKILCVQEQFDGPCLWALVETENEKEERRFELYGTGHKVLMTLKNYIGTFQLRGGHLVFHLFERITDV